VELHLHFVNMLSWRGAQLKNTGTALPFTNTIKPSRKRIDASHAMHETCLKKISAILVCDWQ